MDHLCLTLKGYRTIICLAFALMILANTFVSPLIYLDFTLHRDYIAKVLCIRKDEPITVCGGRCFLVRQLKKAGASESQNTSTQKSIRQDMISRFHRVSLKRINHLLKENDPMAGKNERSAYCVPPDSIFHPPQSAS